MLLQERAFLHSLLILQIFSSPLGLEIIDFQRNPDLHPLGDIALNPSLRKINSE